MEQEIGKVIHYYDRAGVAVVRLSGALAVGDKIKIVKADREFGDTISSMQVDHKNVSAGQAGEEVAIKISEPTKEGARVIKLA